MQPVSTSKQSEHSLRTHTSHHQQPSLQPGAEHMPRCNSAQGMVQVACSASMNPHPQGHKLGTGTSSPTVRHACRQHMRVRQSPASNSKQHNSNRHHRPHHVAPRGAPRSQWSTTTATRRKAADHSGLCPAPSKQHGLHRHNARTVVLQAHPAPTVSDA